MLLNFVDTIGQELFVSLPSVYIRDSHIFLFVFNSININNAKFILIGNKSDLFGEKREEMIRGEEKSSEKIDAHFMTCSAKNADNIDNLERYMKTEAKRFIDEEEKENIS